MGSEQGGMGLIDTGHWKNYHQLPSFCEVKYYAKYQRILRCHVLFSFSFIWCMTESHDLIFIKPATVSSITFLLNLLKSGCPCLCLQYRLHVVFCQNKYENTCLFPGLDSPPSLSEPEFVFPALLAVCPFQKAAGWDFWPAAHNLPSPCPTKCSAGHPK